MLVTIESTLSGSVSGYLNCSVSEQENIQVLIVKFCEFKGIPVNSNFVLKNEKGLELDSSKTIEESHVENGSTLYLEKLDEAIGVFRFTNWWFIAIGALLVACCGLATVLSLHLTDGPTPTRYGVVLDGGSSHTALYVYQWDGPKWQGTGILRQVGSCYIDGDIASYYRNISGIEPLLSPCLSFARSAVPAAQRPWTPIHFGATAGLRLLNMSNPGGAEVLLDGIRNVLSTSGFQFERRYVEVLTGGEEARFSWVSVNTQLKNLGPTGAPGADSAPGGRRLRRFLQQRPSATVGAMDLGGASTQISLEWPPDGGWVAAAGSEAENRWGEEADPVAVLALYGRNYSVYSQSSLCYGILEVFRRYQAMVIQDPSRKESLVPSPCHPSGYTADVTIDHIFSSPCSQTQSSLVARNAADYSERTLTLNGTGDPELCAGYLDRLFNATYCQSQFLDGTCFADHDQLQLDGQPFLAFSSFYATAYDLNMTNSSSLDEFQAAVRRICSMPWDELVQLPTMEPNSTYTPFLCTESQYVLSLLTLGYGFDNRTFEDIYFVHQIANATVGWSMGYMTDRTNVIPESFAQPLLLLAPFAALIVLFGLFFIVGLLLIQHAWRLKRSAQSYSRLQRHHNYGSLTMSL